MAWEITNITFAKIVELDISEETFEKVTKLAEEMGMKFDDCLRYIMEKDIEEHRKEIEH